MAEFCSSCESCMVIKSCAVEFCKLEIEILEAEFSLFAKFCIFAEFCFSVKFDAEAEFCSFLKFEAPEFNAETGFCAMRPPR